MGSVCGAGFVAKLDVVTPQWLWFGFSMAKFPTRSPATGDEIARESRSRCLEVRAVQFRSCPHSNQLGERRRRNSFQSAAIACAYLLYPQRIAQQRPSYSNQVELIAFEPVDKVLQAGRL